MLRNTLYKVNHSSVWHQSVKIWGSDYVPPTADRLLALWLHRIGMMGVKDVALFSKLVRPGDQVADIGANQGLFTVLFAKKVGPKGRVFAFEPEPELYRALTENCFRNQLENVTNHPIAIGSEEKKLTLHRSLFNSGDNRLKAFDQAGGSVEVLSRPLDDVLQGKTLNFIKIDVQGHELQVFQGMEKTIACSPNLKIYFEFWPYGLRNAGIAPQDLIRFIRSKGLKLYYPSHSLDVEFEDTEVLEASLTGTKYSYFLAVKGS